MSDPRPPSQTHRCPSCGTERAAGDPPGGEDDEPITHCEWCGAEYPVPEHDQAPGEAGDPRPGPIDREPT
jgi:hypothetical protein